MLALLSLAYCRFAASGHGRGGTVAMHSLFWGELSNPLQNILRLSRDANNTHIATMIGKVYTPLFLLLRLVVVPYYAFPLAYHMVYSNATPYVFSTWQFGGATLVASYAVPCYYRSLGHTGSRAGAVFFIVATLGGWVWCRSLIATAYRSFIARSSSAASSSHARID